PNEIDERERENIIRNLQALFERAGNKVTAIERRRPGCVSRCPNVSGNRIVKRGGKNTEQDGSPPSTTVSRVSACCFACHGLTLPVFRPRRAWSRSSRFRDGFGAVFPVLPRTFRIQSAKV